VARDFAKCPVYKHKCARFWEEIGRVLRVTVLRALREIVDRNSKDADERATSVKRG